MVMTSQIIKPFELLLEYERRSVAHALGSGTKEESSGDWSGIGFKIGEMFLVSSVDDVNEVVILPELIKIPGIDAWVLGLVNIRSNLIPAIDLKQYLTGEPSRITKHSRMLIIDQPGGQAGLVVDEVFGQRHFQEQSKQAVAQDNDDASDHRVFNYCDFEFELDDQKWLIFMVNQLVQDVHFQNASAR